MSFVETKHEAALLRTHAVTAVGPAGSPIADIRIKTVPAAAGDVTPVRTVDDAGHRPS